jgi:alkanesulfonate monooxygenase SsuD/methylene tetrahydromethanopterin reductase-like flavin-dependent oxidoreductase (luciferase family)
VRFGVVITDQKWVTAADLATIDASRFATLNVVDHPSFPIPDPWTWLAWAAAKTSRVRLGTHVTGAPFHHPQNLARQVATVDLVSGGRAVLGIGTAYEHADFHPYGYSMPRFADRVAMLEECVTILKSLWTRESTTFEGQYYHLEGGAAFNPKPAQQPHPPIWVGLNTDGLALGAAVRCADGINTWQLGPAQLRPLIAAVRERCETAGRDPAGFAVTADVVFLRGGDKAGAETMAGRIAGMARSWGRSERVTQWDSGGVLHGSAAEMREQAAAFADLGVSELSVALSNIDDVRWFSDEVIAAM